MENRYFKKSIKALAVVLSLLMVFYAVPTIVYADVIESISNAFSTDEEAVVIAENVSTTKKEERIYEEIGLREESVKHFRLEDGSYVAAQYSQQVHIKDADGKWQDIDNTLSDAGSDFSTSNARVKFAKKTGGNSELFTLHDGNYKIKMALEGANKKVHGQVTNTNTEFDATATELQKMMTLDKLSSRILYPDILDGVDLEYVIDSMNIKENIIVKEKQTDYSYTFTISLNNLEAELQTDGSIVVFDPDTDAVVYTIPAPIVYDADHAYANTDKAEYALIDNGNGKFTLTVTVDNDWMNAKDRAWPVVVDPAIYTSTSNMIDTYIDSANTSASYGEFDIMYAGYASASHEYISYWKATTLPNLPLNAYISSAKFELCTATHYPFMQAPIVYLGLYNVQTSWNESLTWAQYNSGGQGDLGALIDCVYTTYENDGFYAEWDITALVKQWYDETVVNNGVAIKAATNDATYVALQASESYSQPYLTITYFDTKGLESYWTTLSQNAGNAGIGQINLATGNLIYTVGTVPTEDSFFGFTPTLVYNSNISTQFNTATYNVNVPYKYASAGYGWKLNFNETIVKRDYTDKYGASKHYYVWSDSDGTEHDFYPDGSSTTVYKDNDGLLLTMTVGSSSITIKDTDHNTRHFTVYNGNSYVNNGAVLNKVTDKFGNALNFTLDSYGRVVAVSVTPNQASTISCLTITYNSGNCVSEIRNVITGHKATFEYSDTYNGTAISNTVGGALRRITYAYTSGSTTTPYAVAEYKYNSSSGKLVNVYDATADYRIVYTYSNAGYVQTAVEKGKGSDGQTVAVTYYPGSTMVRSSGADDIYYTTDDIKDYYIFDSQRRTVSTYSTNVEGNMIYGASTGVYEDESGNLSNSLKNTSVSGGVPVNYILNSNFEMDGNMPHWTATTNVAKAVGNSGSYEAVFTVKPNTTDTLTQYVRLPKGTYTLSLTVQTFDCTDVALNLKAISLSNSDHSFSTELPLSEAHVDSTVTPNLTFTVDGGSNGYENFMIVIEAVCKQNASDARIKVDNVMLESGIGSSPSSAVNMGSFEDSSISSTGSIVNTASALWTANGSGISYVTNSGIAGKSAKIIGSITSEKSISQKISHLPAAVWDNNPFPATMTPANFFRFSGFARGTHQASCGYFGFQVEVICYSIEPGGTNAEFVYDFPCNDAITENQFVSGLIVIPDGYFVKTMTVNCIYNNNPGEAYFDNISIVQIDDDSAAIYTYWDDGQLQSVVSPEGESHYVYDANGNITLQASLDGYVTRYTYNSQNAVTKQEAGTIEFISSDPTPLELKNEEYTVNILSVTDYLYNAQGSVTQTATYTPSNNANRIITSTTYITANTINFGKILTYTDENGDTTEYAYDDTTGLPTYVVHPDGTSGLFYNYDSIGRLTQVTPLAYSASLNDYYGVSGEEQAVYTYNSANQLEKINSSTTEYSFTYDGFGNTTSVKAGDYILATYTYNTKNGKLASMTYGNGTVVTYSYDALDRVEKISYNGVERYVYQYTSDGKLHSVTDVTSDVGYLYHYDTNNRLAGYTEYRISDSTNTLAINYTYDDKSRVAKIVTTHDYLVGSNKATAYLVEDYFYNDITDLLEEYAITTTTQTDVVINYTYDSSLRLSQKTLSVGSCLNTVGFTYADRSGGLLSSQIVTYSSRMGSSTPTTYTFTYDQKGNITQIIDSSAGTVRYTYDGLNQLIREDNPYTGKSYVYTYDNSGNRTSKKTYAYTIGTLGTVQSTETYTYGDSTWGDRLTAYNGTSVTYDAIGNPESYYNGFYFTWADGRRLAFASVGMDSYSFTYNDEGIRTSKTYNGYITHKYTLDGSRIVSEEWDNHFILYLYDESGAPIGMQYRTSNYAENVFDTFYFEKNLQGDIVSVYNENGVKLISYSYDAWGNHTATYSNGGGSTGAQYNPFRYRGYYYDIELGLYYLNSRYYDSNIGRFINADGQLNNNILGYNQYAYCENNPVMYVDHTGKFPWLVLAALIVIATVSFSGCEIPPPERRPAGAYDSFDEALESGLNEVYNLTQQNHKEFSGYVFEEGGYYFYRAGRDRLSSTYNESVVFDVNLEKGETLKALFHSHTSNEYSPENTFSLQDYWRMTEYDVDSYVVDTQGWVYKLPFNARNYTEAERIYSITINKIE